MKQFILFFFCSLLIGSSCRKPKPVDPVKLLPPETQTGANTFGCLLNGQVFKPKGDPFAGPVIKAQYQLVNGKQGFGISASRRNGDVREGIGVAGDSVKLFEGVFELAQVDAGRFVAGYTYRDLNTISGIQYGTTATNRGQLTITKFDTVNQIISGRFWFDAIDTTTGKIVQIREGRFDLPYVK